ncbi:MAG: Abi family protein [Atopobiaceae bacterium]|nr:Abi family protein [Atopobiaceae bacterium]
MTTSRSAWARDKSKLTLEQQVRYIKDTGVSFNLYSEAEALVFLRDETYFNKITAFGPLWKKDADGRFYNLDFGQLVDLWRIDRLLSQVCMLMTLEIEAWAKEQIVSRCDQLNSEDGYSLVDDFWNSLDKANKKNLRNDLHINADRRMLEGSPWMDEEYLEPLLDKYELDLPVWVLMLTAFFNTLQMFYRFCGRRWHDEQMVADSYLLLDVKNIRNLCAHNNGLLVGLSEAPDEGKLAKHEAFEALGSTGVDSQSCKKQMKQRRMRELLSVIYLYGRIVSEGLQDQEGVLGLVQTLVERIRAKREVFSSNSQLADALQLVADACTLLVSAPSQTTSKDRPLNQRKAHD